MMHFPQLWEEDSLIYDDREEREVLLRQFQELLEEISLEEGYHEKDPKDDPFGILSKEKAGKIDSGKNLIQPSSMFTPPPTRSTSWYSTHLSMQDNRMDATLRRTLGEDDQCRSPRQQTKRYEVPIDGMSVPNNPGEDSPLTAEGIARIKSFGNSTRDGFLDNFKVHDMNYSSELYEPDREESCTGGIMSLNSSSKSPLMQKSDLRVISLMKSPLAGDGKVRRRTAKRLSKTGVDSSQQSGTTTPRKRVRREPFQTTLPRSPRSSEGEIPESILKDLKVIRTHRRSAYADGDSLVEVQPASLPGSPTMFAYRDHEGRLRVPLDMQCNQQALVTYKSIAPSGNGLQHKIVSVRDEMPYQSEAVKHAIQEEIHSDGKHVPTETEGHESPFSPSSNNGIV